MTPLVSVILSTHNPHPGRLERTLKGLRQQTLPPAQWETLLIDNASTQVPARDFFIEHGPGNLRVIEERTLGLTSARRRGFVEAKAPVAILVDDDNVLDPGYLDESLNLLSQYPKVGACGGRVVPDFESRPPEWAEEFFGLLALRDLGDQVQVSHGLTSGTGGRNSYPAFAPFGAGMIIRREAWGPWVESLSTTGTIVTDRKGTDLTSGGDNDIVFSVLSHGWEVAYFPSLNLQHLIPPGRLEPEYLERLNRAIQRSWVQVLARYDACPWASIPPWTVPLRQARAWWRSGAWRGPVQRIRWHGLAGRLAGLGDISAQSGHPN